MALDGSVYYRALQTRDPRFDGRIYVAVHTTGVYCRPICPARCPRRENVTFYPSAAAAQEAGYRPCLRCRPESSPDLAVWRGTSATVSRALSLISEGALADDEAGVGGLAERLGIGDRHLRRLFQRHLGATPVAVVSTWRVLFAKKLVHETDMRMAEVAMAAGFGSVRRFNAAFHRLFARAPSSLRRRRSTAGPITPHAPVTLSLPHALPYDWDAMVTFLDARAIPGVEHVTATRYVRTFAVGAHHGVVEVSPGRRGVLSATIRFPDVTALPSIVARIRRVFDLGADIDAIEAHLRRDPLLGPLIARRPGLRVPGAWDGFELAIRAVLGQQITVAAARALAARLAARHGAPLAEELAGATGLSLLFPAPGQIARADLSVLGMPQARAKTLSGVAAAAVAEPALLGGDAGIPPHQVVERLREIPGVGDWTAQYIALRALRDPDAFPATDVGLLRAVARGTGERADARALLVRAESWRPWRAYAAQHLWMSDVDELYGPTGRVG